MSLCEGNVISPGSANENQVYTLGKAIGRMHQLLNSHNTNPYPLHWDIRSKEEMLEHWNYRWKRANNMKCEKTIRSLEVQRKIIDETQIDIFSNCERGWLVLLSQFVGFIGFLLEHHGNTLKTFHPADHDWIQFIFSRDWSWWLEDAIRAVSDKRRALAR
ncbi:hypothetical protein [Paenibacillus xerothermodurans]|uniref:Aminoglycoside phosphotransferase domain-containing protein n=1 Tax=Paenibacillus xerothermodurans TaxID=1977292 RepID=A0A2W1N9I3_PAEXE|nr:hypothetical protein [Paenibacillus xerothermodurans]PZE20320.1 hypothetical protein CBW46_014340 [Paenibacillus xerothermodurans]